MRITKNIREYIEKVVSERVEKKYAEELKQARKNRELQKTILSTVNETINKQARELLLTAVKGNPNIFEVSSRLTNEDNNLFYFHHYASQLLPLVGENYTDSIYGANNRMRKEIKETTQNIIVELELDGNKADLDRMLSEI